MINDELIQAVSYWMSFQKKIGRKFMMEEASIKYPVADFLTSTTLRVDDIKLEFNHPYLKYRRIDLVIKDSKVKNSKASHAIEFKLATTNTTSDSEKQRIFNDLMRMYIMNNNDGTEAYFMIIGEWKDFIYNFRNIPKAGSKVDLDKPAGFFTSWLSFVKNEEIEIDIKKPVTDECKDIYEEFFNSYQSKKNQRHPIRFEPNALQLQQCLRITRFHIWRVFGKYIKVFPMFEKL